MTWRAARSLLQLQRQLKAGAPRAAPPATPADAWGLVGDTAHSSTSDHTPHDFPGWGTQIVTAADFPHAPALGLDSRQVCEDIRRSRDPRVKYMISQDQICSSYPTSTRAAWTWGPYNPNDPNRDRHDTHAHLSVVGDARADGEAPWRTIGAVAPITIGDDEMIIAKDPASGQLYLCDGMVSRKITAADVPNIRYLAGQGAYALAHNTGGNNVDWEGDGWIRKGWTEGAFGAVEHEPSPVEVTVTGEQLDTLAAGVAAKLGALRFEASA